MKIAFIVDRFPSLSETFILSQITGLVDRGQEVDIYASGSGNDQAIHRDVERYNLLEHTFFHGDSYQSMPANIFLRLAKAVGLIAANSEQMPRSLVRSLNVLKFGKKAASLSLFYKTKTFLDSGSNKYDIVHCHFGPNGYLGALLKDVGAIRGKLITTFHGHDVSKYQKSGSYDLDYLFEVGDIFLPVSERWRRKLINLGGKEQKIIVHRMGIDTGKFLLSPRQARADGKIRLLTVARLVEKKGVKYGIQAVARVAEKYPQLEYRIAGGGPLQSDLKDLIDELNLNDKAKLLGWQRQEEIVKLMREADILLAPSVTSADGDQEGIPVVLMEALAQGLPVLSTQHSGIPELVQDGKSGFLVPERDVAALADKLVYLIEYPEMWPEMGRVGRDYVGRYYDIQKLNDQLVQLYERLLEGGNCIGQVV
jgi:colanic acid/amylovoran biosynthesis glycosyltransferase